MQQRDEAFVLRTQALGDADLIVSLFAEHHGSVRGVARSARRSRRRFGGLLEPMTHVEAVWFEKAGRELHRIEQVDGRRSFAAMQADPLHQAVTAGLAELTEAFASAGQADPRGFRLLGAVLEALDGGAEPLAILRYYEYWTLRLHGLLPDAGSCGVCSRPLPAKGPHRIGWADGFRCAECEARSPDPGRRLCAAEARFLEALRTLAPDDLPPERGAARPRGALEALLRGTLETYVERKFKSYRHIRALAIDDGVTR